MSNLTWSHVMGQLRNTTHQLQQQVAHPSQNLAEQGEKAISGNYQCMNRMRDEINHIERGYTKCLVNAKGESDIIGCIHHTAEQISKTRFGFINPNHTCGPVYPNETVHKVTHSATKCISDSHTGKKVKSCVKKIKHSDKHHHT